MESIEIIKLQRARDYSRKVNATFEFIKQNFKGLVKSLVYISGPSILVVSILIGSVFSDFFSVVLAGVTDPERMENYMMSASFWAQIALIVIFLVVGAVMTISAINNYILLYDEKKTNQIQVKDVWDRVRSTFWMYFGTVFGFYLLMIVVFIFLAVIIAALSAVSTFAGGIGMILFYVAIFYIVVTFSMVFFIRAYEKKGFFEAVARSFFLVRGKWWSTFGLLMTVFFVMYTISMLFILPFYILLVVNMVHSVQENSTPSFSETTQWVMVVVISIYYSLSLLLNSLPNIAIAFQYFNLVEIKESRGLISEIETIGQTPVASADEEQY